MTVQVYEARSAQGNALLGAAGRPFRVNNRTGEVQLQTTRGLTTNSLLLKDEWEDLESTVIEAARKPLVVVQDLQSAGLVKSHGSIGVLMSEWGMRSEMTPAESSMTGRQRADRDRAEYKLQGVPIPVISKEFEIGDRELEAARRMGTSLNLENAMEATRVVSEYLENMAIAGDASINFGGSKILGITNYTDAITDTATNWGGGDWGTAGNALSTVTGMIIALQETNNHYGPYHLLVPSTQYNEVAFSYLSADNDRTELNRIEDIPSIAVVRQVPFMTAGTVALVQWDRDVVEWGQTWDTRVIEVPAPLVMSTIFRVVAIQTMRCKSRYDGKSGIAVATGC